MKRTELCFRQACNFVHVIRHFSQLVCVLQPILCAFSPFFGQAASFKFFLIRSGTFNYFLFQLGEFGVRLVFLAVVLARQVTSDLRLDFYHRSFILLGKGVRLHQFLVVGDYRFALPENLRVWI